MSRLARRGVTALSSVLLTWGVITAPAEAVVQLIHHVMVATDATGPDRDSPRS